VIGVDPVGSIFTAASPQDVHSYLIEGVGEDFWPETLDASMIDRYITVSDRDAFLMTRRLALVEGILAGGSGGMATWAALEVARGISDPDAVVVVILPDGGRSYLSKIFNDAWMTEYGFLERSGERTVGDVLRKRTAGGDVPRWSRSTPIRSSATRSRCCTSTAYRSFRSSPRATLDDRRVGCRARAARARRQRPGAARCADNRRDGAATARRHGAGPRQRRR